MNRRMTPGILLIWAFQPERRMPVFVWSCGPLYLVGVGIVWKSARYKSWGLQKDPAPPNFCNVAQNIMDARREPHAGIRRSRVPITRPELYL